MKAIATLLLAVLGCSTGAAPAAPDPTLTLVVDRTHRTALGPLMVVHGEQHCPQGTHCDSGRHWRTRTRHAALSVCIPNDASVAPRVHLSWYGTNPGRVQLGRHSTELDASNFRIVHAQGHTFIRLMGTVTVRHIGTPASFTGIEEPVEIELLGETRLG